MYESMYSVQILTKYLNILWEKKKEKKKETRNLSLKVSSSQGQEWDVNLFEKKNKTNKLQRTLPFFFNKQMSKNINEQENVPSHNHYT